MRIAVIGSWKTDSTEPMLRNFAEFVKACEDIGHELAKQGQVVIIGSESASTADHHVANGMLRYIGDIPDCRCQMVIIHESVGRQPYHELAQQFPKHFSYPPIVGEGWAGAHLRQIEEADAVLTIGGSSGTLNAGLAAIVARKVVVPIGTFGGASKRLANELFSKAPPLKEQLARLASPWSSHVLETAAELLGIRHMPRILIIHGHGGNDRDHLKKWLQETLGLNDILIMQEEFGCGKSLPEKFEQLAARADGAIALATPDDFVASDDGNPPTHRARQNVWLEVGWIWGRLGRGKVMLLRRGKIEHPSDIQGLEYYSYSSSPVEVSDRIKDFITGLSAAK